MAAPDEDSFAVEKPPPSRMLLYVVIGIASLAVLVYATDDDPQAARPATTVTQTQAAPAAAITAWGQGGGKAVTDSVGNAMILVGSAGNDAVLLHSYCLNLDEVVAAAQKYPPMPDAQANLHWTRALGYARETARSCISLVTTGNPMYEQRTIDAASLCKAESEKALARIKTVKGLPG